MSLFPKKVEYPFKQYLKHDIADIVGPYDKLHAMFIICKSLDKKSIVK